MLPAIADRICRDRQPRDGIFHMLHPSTDFELVLTPAQAAVAAKAMSTLVDLRSGRIEVLVDLFDEGVLPTYREERQDPWSDDAIAGMRKNFEGGVLLIRDAVFAKLGSDPRHALLHSTGAASTERLETSRGEFLAAAAVDQESVVVPVDAMVAHLVDEALELYSRMGAGQMEDVRHVVSGVCMTDGYDEEMSVKLEEGVFRLRESLNFRSGHSYGIGSDRLAPGIKSCWEIHKAMQKALAMDRDPNPSFRTVNYDGNWLRWTQDPEPLCRPVKAPEPTIAF
jgi:hypothetical protein